MPPFQPVNLTAEQLKESSEFPAATAVPKAPKPSELVESLQENYVLSESLAAKLGFSVGDAGSKIEHKVLVFGVSHYKEVPSESHSYRFGVAVRAVIIVTNIEVNLDLTPAIVAASVELGRATASASIHVRGYKGSLELPPWQSFNLESHEKFQESISDLQKNLLGGDDANLAPVLLATTAVDVEVPPVAPSLGVLYALTMIRRQHSLHEAIDNLRAKNPEVERVVRSVYTVRVGSDQRAKPDDDMARTARDDIEGYQVDRGLLHRG